MFLEIFPSAGAILHTILLLKEGNALAVEMV